MRIFQVTGCEAIANAQQFVVLVLEHSFTMQNAFALLRYYLADARASRLEIIDDVFGLIQFGSILEDWKTDSVPQRVAYTVGGHGAVAIIDSNLLGLQLNLAVSDFRLTIKPNEFPIDAHPDRISGSIVDGSFDVATWGWNCICLNIQAIRCNIEAVRSVRKSIGGYRNCVLPHWQRTGRIFYRVLYLGNRRDCDRKKYYDEYERKPHNPRIDSKIFRF